MGCGGGILLQGTESHIVYIFNVATNYLATKWLLAKKLDALINFISDSNLTCLE